MTSDICIFNMDDELCKYNLTLYAARHELWRTEEKCCFKKKSIEEIEYATKHAEIKNEFIEKQLQFTKSKIEEVRDTILCMDRMICSLYDTLAHLEVQYDKMIFSINKSKTDYELQIFLKTELWRKEEERFNNIPEIKSLNMANSELESTKFEYQELLKQYEHLKEKISEAEEKNDKMRNGIVVEFVTLYLQNQSLDENIENDKALLRKCKAEYQEKLNLKNAVLESRKDLQFYSKSINKVSYWVQNPHFLDSKILDIQFDLLDEGSSFNHDTSLQRKLVVKPSTPSHKPPQIIEDQVLDINYNTHLSNNDISPYVPPTNINPHADVDGDQCLSYVSIESRIIDFDNNKTLENGYNFDFQIKKRKSTEVQSDFEFKKPSNLQHVTFKNDLNTDIINSKNIQPLEKNINPFNDTLIKSTELPTVTNAFTENTKISDLLAVPCKSILSTNNDRALSDVSSDDSDIDCSKTSSLFDPEFFEIFKSTYNAGQHQDVQSDNVNMINNNSSFSSPNHESSSIGSKSRNHQLLASGICQQLQNESDTTSDIPKEETTSKENNLVELYQPHFMSSDIFR